jgi:hypothetical protein
MRLLGARAPKTVEGTTAGQAAARVAAPGIMVFKNWRREAELLNIG